MPDISVPGFIGSKMYLVGHGDVPYPAGLAYCKSLIQSLFGRKHGNGWSMKGWLNPVLLPGNTTIPQLRAWIPYLMQSVFLLFFNYNFLDELKASNCFNKKKIILLANQFLLSSSSLVICKIK